VECVVQRRIPCLFVGEDSIQTIGVHSQGQKGKRQNGVLSRNRHISPNNSAADALLQPSNRHKIAVFDTFNSHFSLSTDANGTKYEETKKKTRKIFGFIIQTRYLCTRNSDRVAKWWL